MHWPLSRRLRRQISWTPLELSTLALSLLLMASAGAEIYRWVNPPVAPAAARSQELATETPAASPTDVAPTATPTSTPAPPTSTPMPPTATAGLPTATLAQATATAGLPTATPAPEQATPAPSPAQAEPPTAIPTATAGPLETVVVDPPLTISQLPTVASVAPGGQFSYVVHVVSTSHQQRSIRMQMLLDEQMDVVEVSSSVGSCQNGTPVVCVITAQLGQPARIQVDVRVHSDAALGSSLSARTIAEDDERVTAAADPAYVYLDIVGNTHQSNGVDQAIATPQAQFIVETHTPTAQPDAGAGVTRAASTARPTSTATASPTASPAPTAAALASDEAAATPPLPPTLGPSTPSGGGDPIDPTVASPMLPDTGAALPALGIGLGLFGIALTVHSARRIRRADGELTDRGAEIGQLSPLIDDVVGQQHATVAEIRRMQKDSDEMLAMLRGKKA
ncbi:hypothetical protein F8S13_04600 [Chloroflexia bacterium SDU3-3]|nr:hypothetical protein F8S13_04600 [Chloroflexia bacterium SDU3-3]